MEFGVWSLEFRVLVYNSSFSSLHSPLSTLHSSLFTLHSYLNLASALKCTEEGHFVGIFKVAADRQTRGDSCHPDAQRL